MKKINVVEIEMVKDSTIKLDLKGTEAKEVAKFIRDFIGASDREHLILVALNARGRVVAVNEVSIGSVSASIAHPREIFKPAILSNASAIFLAHNHPSDEIDPSQEDIRLTERIRKASQIMGIELWDHFVIGSQQFYSIEKRMTFDYPTETQKAVA